MNHKKIERKSLIVSSIVNGLSGTAGMAVYIMTGLNALLLDGVFSLIAFVSSMVAFYISKNSHRKTTTFPQGLYFLEPLYAIMKSLATLLLLLFAVLETSTTAFAYFVNGIGHTMTTGPVVPYTITMFLIYMGLYFYNRHMSARLNHMSIIIQAESKGNLVDGLISGAIGLAVILLHFIPISSPLGFLHYTGDFFLTVVLALISFKEPWDGLVVSFKELANGTIQAPEIHDSIYQILETYLDDHTGNIEIHIFKQGMNIRVKINLHNVQHEIVRKLLEDKQQMIYLLKKKHEYISVEYAL
ncbi:cation transporter [Streptococcus parasuis]|uniref:cation transporter n=2 Tax=Streptococcus parasuis TaxID=1501662 RepID=UPI0028B1A8ED|nr:cation transporter [Streptococcus parasuis]